MKEQAQITALYKKSANTPWRVSIGLNKNYFAIAVGGEGGVAISPRFNIFLTEIEKRVKRYPVEITFYHLTENCDIELTRINNKVVYIDCGFELKRAIPKAKYSYQKYITGSPLTVSSVLQEDDTVATISVITDDDDVVSENIASTTMDYIAVAKITDIADGDTISVKIEETSDFIKKYIDVDEEITIRFLGVDTPETRTEEEDGYKLAENTETANLFGITVDDVYDIGEEAKECMTELLNYKNGGITYCILHFDRAAEGRAPITDSYGRYLCEVYACSGSSASTIYKKVERGESFLHTNKTILTTFSETFTHVPLGIYSFEYAYGDTSVLNCFDWISELGITNYTTGTNILGGSLSEDLLPDSEEDDGTYETTLNTMTLEFGQEIAPNSNNLNFFEPYDDRIDEFLNGVETVEQLENHSRVRIGDCILTIPPTSISVNKTSNIKKVKTLRTKSSVMVNRGQTLTTLTMELYFHNLENVNGIKYPWRKDYAEGDEKKYFFVDGLRPLLAQFAKAPFLPICNYYINDTLGIQDVALLDLEVSTVPNYPESLVATITLMEFDSSCYTMSEASLYEAINFPMLRWYYNQSLENQSDNYKHRFFKGIEGQITNDISFSIANQAYLEQRKVAIDYIKKADSPEQVMYELKNNNTTYSAKKSDAKKAKQALKIYNAYNDLSIGEHDIIDYPADIIVNGLNEILQEVFDVSENDAEDIIAKGKEYYVGLYEDATNGDYKKDILKFSNIYVPYESDQFYSDRFQYSATDWMKHPIVASKIENLPIDYTESIYSGTMVYGYFKIDVMEDTGNQALLEENYKSCYNEKKECFYLPATNEVVELLKEIKNGASDMVSSVEEYEREYNAMLEILDGSEEDVNMDEWTMEGTFIPVSVSAHFSNEFATVPVQTASTPSLQFLGGGDAYLDIVAETDDDGARSINELIEQADRLARMYNIGITNGFVGINNHLAGLFGIQYIMFESLTINTMPNYPGRYQVYMRAISFDKTQRRREELTALSANSSQIDAETLKGNRNAYANDRMLEARLRTLDPYPDLELPTYDEINEALPQMDAGGCTEYQNLTNGVYMDPDFYFSTKSTFRELVENEYMGDHQLNMYDSTGIAAYTSSTDYDRLFNMTEEDIAKMEELESETESVGWLEDQINKMNSQDGEETESVSTSTGDVISQTNGKAAYKNEAVRAFMEDTDENGKYAYETFPTWEEWQKLFPSGNHGKKGRWQLMKDTPNGTEFQIYKKIDMLVDKHFKSHYSYPDFIKDCKGDMDDANKTQRKISYTPAAEFYTLAADYAFENATTSVMDRVKTLIKEGTITVPDNETDISFKNFGKADGKITKERFITIFKAFLDKMSGWQQYNGSKPSVGGAGRVGICQTDITGEDITLDEVKRLMYNWRYNMEVAFEQLVGHYTTASTLKEGNMEIFCMNFESYVRPWDTMFALYSDPSGTFDTAESVEENDYAKGVMNRFNSYATKPFNTRSGYNTEVYTYACGLSDEDLEAIYGSDDVDTIIETLLSLHYYDLSYIKSEGLTVDSKYTTEIMPVMEEYLQTCSLELLQQIYQSHVTMLAGLDSGMIIASAMGTTPTYAGSEDGNGYHYSGDIIMRAADLYQSIKAMNQAALDSIGSTDTRLYNDVDPQTIYQEMFYDLRYHDQRGRMLRAFPTFQMFIIHEGDYFGAYKFWDNMYGFNAIESIDVYRSRKIAADTAVISMTNIYGNLTTRRTDVDYADRQLKWWDNYIWNTIPDSLIDKKTNEVHKNIYLEPGARIHLRMGYGGNAQDLPIVFNGTITEMDTGDVIEIIAQGDGIELGNVISGDPDDDNNGLFYVTEPRDLICKFMASKGNWLKDFFNNVTEGLLFEENPLGIMHFGNPWNSEENGGRLLGTINWFNDDYGEVAQNIYSSNGTPTFSQWMHPNGEKNTFFSNSLWDTITSTSIFDWFNPGDEENVVVNFYNQTVWDIIQTITYCSPDYIATVLPFELRSSLFFGKPYWRCAFQYGSTYYYNETEKTWVRHLQSESRRPYMQHKFYTSQYDIVENNIKATEDTLFTNVIVNYDGHQTPVLYADADIRYDKHKTRMVEANICAEGVGLDFYTSEVMATYYGCSVLRDIIKDMYKGNLLVLGDPTVKPYDMMYLSDTISDMNGNCLVKAVTHHFSMDTGFVTSIEPDIYVSNDDTVMQSLAEWSNSAFAGFAAQCAATAAGSKAVVGMYKWLLDSEKLPGKVGQWLTTKGLYRTAKLAGDDSAEMKSILKDLQEAIDAKDADSANTLRKNARDNLINYIQKIEDAEGLWSKTKAISSKATLSGVKKALDSMVDAGKFAKGAKTALAAARGASCVTIVGFVANIVCWIGSEILFEKYRRKKENLQCVICMPLTYQGKEFVAGITNHAGMVYGDSPGRLKSLYNASLGLDDGDEVEGLFGNTIIELFNHIAGTAGTYVDTSKEAELNALSGIELPTAQ